MKTVQRKEVIKFYQIINHDEPVAVMSFRPPLIGVASTNKESVSMQFFNFNVGETPTKGVSPNLFKDYKINTFDLEMVI